MDIAILAAARFPSREPFPGGLEAHTHWLAERLWRRGHRVTVYAADGAGPYDVWKMPPMDFDASPRARRDVAAGPRGVLAEHHSYLAAILELQRRQHELVHINAVHHLPFACAGLLRPSAVTATMHTPPTPWLESAMALGSIHRTAPKVVSVSHANARAWGGVPHHDVIHNGVDLERWPAGDGGTGAAWWGRLVPEKAPHLAIDAARLAGVALTVMGPIHDDAYFLEEVRPRLGGDVVYAGHLTTAEVAAVAGSSAVALVTPAWDEPFGLVVAEALACGTPVAAFDRGALPELLDERTGRVTPANDAQALADAIPTVAGLNREDCRRRAERCFSSDVMADRYEAWFRRVLRAAAGDL